MSYDSLYKLTTTTPRPPTNIIRQIEKLSATFVVDKFIVFGATDPNNIKPFGFEK